MFLFPNINTARTASSPRCQCFSLNGEFPPSCLHSPPPPPCWPTENHIPPQEEHLEWDKHCPRLDHWRPYNNTRVLSLPFKMPRIEQGSEGWSTSKVWAVICWGQGTLFGKFGVFLLLHSPFLFLPGLFCNVPSSGENMRQPCKSKSTGSKVYRQATSCSQGGTHVKHTEFLREHLAPSRVLCPAPGPNPGVTFFPCCPSGIWASRFL